ncbi:DUF3817 domain-containing protein [Streptomyces zingiberis]|uniref:DUF3817 domain-containing protein n=1 Tax=Streptomyces zingiberis TaxID=2053010 RepID=A0ABX1BZM5_9ACTN|nr:DUF3817 domain-containing protein [Streptomyces zingiberis]NJQ00774.1 DUF3817 domain-containing protein [Streptomyces zingiberis]
MDIKTAAAIRRLRIVSAVEAVSFLVLLVCSVLKRTTEFNAVPVMGAVHGLLVVVFLVVLADAWNRAKWPVKKPLLYTVLSVIPVGGFYAERLLRREEEAGAIAARARREGVVNA